MLLDFFSKIWTCTRPDRLAIKENFNATVPLSYAKKTMIGLYDHSVVDSLQNHFSFWFYDGFVIVCSNCDFHGLPLYFGQNSAVLEKYSSTESVKNDAAVFASYRLLFVILRNGQQKLVTPHTPYLDGFRA